MSFDTAPGTVCLSSEVSHVTGLAFQIIFHRLYHISQLNELINKTLAGMAAYM